MSEASDDAQLAAKEGAAPSGGPDAPPDLDDVEVLAHPPDPDPTPRLDSVIPTSRKLAPPPKPKRDSQNPSVPPPPDAAASADSLKVPSAPALSVHDAGATSLDSIAAALASTDSLRAIGEALTREVTPGPRVAVPRPRSSQPSIASVSAPGVAGEGSSPRSASEPPRAREQAPTTPDDVPVAPKSTSSAKAILVQRIIAVGTPSERAPAAPPPAPPPAAVEADAPPPAAPQAVAPAPPDWDRTLDVAQEPTRAPIAPAAVEPGFPPPITATTAPAPAVIEPAFPPPVVAAPTQAGSTALIEPGFPPPILQAMSPPPQTSAVEAGFPPPVVSAPSAPGAIQGGFPPPIVAAPSAASAPALIQGGFPPPVVDLASTAPRAVETAARPAVVPAPPAADDEPDAGALSITVDISMDEQAPGEPTPDDAPPHIPITTDDDEDEKTSPSASVAPLENAPQDSLSAPIGAPTIPDEPTPPPPALAQVEEHQPSVAEERAPDSLDRLPVEELSREDSPSVPPEAPATAAAPPASAPPPVPVRAEVKPPPPPKRAAALAPSEPVGEPEKKKSKQKRPWWEELFSEDFVRANWKVSDEQIKREVTFVEESLGVAPGGVVLDLGCGSGQHAVELASRGYGVVGYDLSLYQLALAADNAQERSQKINFLQGDMREMAFEEMFDGIFCWNTSFGYFEEDKNFSVAERAFRALRPGGMFLVDVINRDFVAAHTPSSVWFEGDACVCMDDAVIDYFTSRLRVKRSVILDDGRTRECTYSVRLYSFHELGKLLHEVGFRVTEVSGHPATPGVFLGQASPRILMLAQRP